MRTNVFAAAFSRADITCLQQSRLHKKKTILPQPQYPYFILKISFFQNIFSLLKNHSWNKLENEHFVRFSSPVSEGDLFQVLPQWRFICERVDHRLLCCSQQRNQMQSLQSRQKPDIRPELRLAIFSKNDSIPSVVGIE